MITKLKAIVARLRIKLRHKLCVAVNGGHELYRAHSDTRLYQQCLLCGYETRGWTVDRRDRKLPSVKILLMEERKAKAAVYRHERKQRVRA